MTLPIRQLDYASRGMVKSAGPTGATVLGLIAAVCLIPFFFLFLIGAANCFQRASTEVTTRDSTNWRRDGYQLLTCSGLSLIGSLYGIGVVDRLLRRKKAFLFGIQVNTDDEPLIDKLPAVILRPPIVPAEVD
jgi:hypothetical protein